MPAIGRKREKKKKKESWRRRRRQRRKRKIRRRKEADSLDRKTKNLYQTQPLFWPNKTWIFVFHLFAHWSNTYGVYFPKLDIWPSYLTYISQAPNNLYNYLYFFSLSILWFLWKEGLHILPSLRHQANLW